MGSTTCLSVGRFEVDWGKNDFFRTHGEFFQPGDLVQLPQVDGNDGEESHVIGCREGASRLLRRVLPRLTLLGHTLDGARAEFEALAEADGGMPVSFDQLLDALSRFDVDEPPVGNGGDDDPGEYVQREILGRLSFRSAPPDLARRRDVGMLLEGLSPGSVLAMLATNPANLDKPVVWDFGDVVDGGWADRDEIVADLGRVRRFLVVTEGSSDARILRHALSLLRPDVADFFRFVDMEDGYPFTGTGSLHRFCQGLVSIGIENRVLVVYDNDAEGSARHRDTSALGLPPNMRVMRLPDDPRLRSFATRGPDGEGVADVNGRAAAIECYLDLRGGRRAEPMVRWTSWSRSAGRYQGELEAKVDHARRFLKLRAVPSGYDTRGLELVLDAMLAECTAIADAAS